MILYLLCGSPVLYDNVLGKPTWNSSRRSQTDQGLGDYPLPHVRSHVNRVPVRYRWKKRRVNWFHPQKDRDSSPMESLIVQRFGGDADPLRFWKTNDSIRTPTTVILDMCLRGRVCAFTFRGRSCMCDSQSMQCAIGGINWYMCSSSWVVASDDEVT